MTPPKPPCGFPACGEPSLTAGKCRRHYAEARLSKLAANLCRVEGCGRPQYCKLLCRGHYARQRDGRTVESLLEVRQPSAAHTRCVLLLPKELVSRLEARAAPGERFSATVRRLLMAL